MDICTELKSIQSFSESALTIGAFDGMHCGHVEVIKELVSISREKGIPSVVVSFDPHPKIIVNSDQNRNWNQLVDTPKKLEILESIGVDYLLLIPFDLAFSGISASVFLEDYLIKYFNPRDIIAGYDHHFGHKQKGDAVFLESNKSKYDYNLHIIEPIRVNGETVSSTHIRNLIHEGKIKQSNAFLGWDFELSGEVVKGNEVGRVLNFPTANIHPNSDLHIIPLKGVYCVEVKVNGSSFPGMCNIGTRPTFYEKGQQIIEVHIISNDELNLYGEQIRLVFKQYLRREKKYASSEELVDQLHLDRHACLSQ